MNNAARSASLTGGGGRRVGVTDNLSMPSPDVVLGVGGGIAAYKACELLRLFTESGHGVTVVPTASALRFVGEPTWAALSGRPVAAEVWERVHEVPHVRIGRHADLVVVAPATADLLAKAAHGLADDLLTNTLLTATCPVVFAPAMHTEMWENAATQENVATLRRRGLHVIEPAVGRLTGADTGKGRLPDPSAIFEYCRSLLARGTAEADLTGMHIVVSAGGTREPIDPVRFIGNRSSGKQGYALASTAVARGARVTLVAANTALPDPAGVDVVRVSTTAELRGAVRAAAGDADVVVMAAAVADFRPAEAAESKIKKSDDSSAPEIRLVQNPHVLRELGHARVRAGQTVVGFAAETGDTHGTWLEHGRAKLAKYGVDLLIVNEVGVNLTFGADHSAAVVIGADGSEDPVPDGPKERLADVIWDRVLKLRSPTD